MKYPNNTTFITDEITHCLINTGDLDRDIELSVLSIRECVANKHNNRDQFGTEGGIMRNQAKTKSQSLIKQKGNVSPKSKSRPKRIIIQKNVPQVFVGKSGLIKLNSQAQACLDLEEGAHIDFRKAEVNAGAWYIFKASEGLSRKNNPKSSDLAHYQHLPKTREIRRSFGIEEGNSLIFEIGNKINLENQGVKCEMYPLIIKKDSADSAR